MANKWDLAGKREIGTAEDFQTALATQIPFARQAPILLVSAKTGRGIARILETAARVAENRHAADLDGRAQPRSSAGRCATRRPGRRLGRTLKVFYVAQTGVAPPTFALVAEPRASRSTSRRSGASRT